MTKHIHLHLPPGARVRTGDNWEESKHKRDDSGKFGSGGGAKPAAKEAPSSKPPTTLVHGGKKHTATGKTGKTPSGEETHEYEAVDDQGRRTGARVWRTASGKVIPD